MTVALAPWQSLAGGALIGAGAAVLMLGNGRIAGISGIVDRILVGTVGPQAWRAAFVIGLVVPALIWHQPPAALPGTPELIAISGLLVGYGTRAANGCTSGHGVCGLAGLSRRSLVATATFLGVATVTAWAHGIVGGGT